MRAETSLHRYRKPRPAPTRARQRQGALLGAAILALACGGTGAGAAEALFTGWVGYDLTLLSAAPDTLVRAATGTARQEVRQTCSAFVQTTDANIAMTSTDGQELTLQILGEMAEDGDTLAFRWTTWANGTIAENSIGVATRSAGGVRVELSEPERKTVNLPANVRFPMDVARAAIAAAAAGQVQAQFVEFNGSGDGETPEDVTVTFAPAPAAVGGREAAIVAANGFAGLPHWWMRFASVPRGGQGDAITTEATVYANGAVLGGTYDVAGLRFAQTPTELVPVKPVACPG